MSMAIRWSKPYGRSLKQRCSIPFEYKSQNGEVTTTSFTSEIGSIKQKNDGRWEYIILPAYRKGWGWNHPFMVSETLVQGVCSTKEEAIAKVEANYCVK